MVEQIEIIDVAPRDGLQSQPKLVDTSTKVELVTRLIEAGVRRMEVVSFVNPKKIPQMADADEVLKLLPKREDVTYIGLVLNMRGFERAVSNKIDEINCVVVASDTFNQRNQGVTTEQTMQSIEEIANQSKSMGLTCGVTISAAFGCPFEGEVPVGRVVDLAKRLINMGVDEIALADTIGAAGPSDVSIVIRSVREVTGDTPLRCHFHNTRNTGVANVYAAIMEGVRIFDASCGGVGGCPFAPAATGNVATEDLLYMINRMGIETGISIEGIMEITRWLEGSLEAQMPAMVTRAGLFPSNAVHDRAN
jgi:hydroxymethylglutaryl-CoA lyase